MRKLTLSLSKRELLLINNALNEVANGADIDDEEFETRLGENRIFVKSLLERITKIIDES